MSPLAALLAVAALIAVTTVVGLAWRARNGRVAQAAPDARDVVRQADVGSADPFGEKATLLQFSTEFCAYCPSTRRLLGQLADRTEGVTHVDVDLTHSPELAQRFKVLQTPTTLLLDGAGAVRARIGGAPRPIELEATLERILNGDDLVAA